VFDTGVAGCGELLINLRSFLLPLDPRTVVAVVARDAGAPVDLPAWCRMSGHQLLAQAHHHYLIERKET